MNYTEFGDRKNPTILFLHGAMFNLCFTRQEVLQQYYHLVFLDLAGHGGDKRKFTREAGLEDIEELKKMLNKERISIVGFSLGTQVALMYADLNDCIDNLILISPLISADKATIKFINFGIKASSLAAKLPIVSFFVRRLLKIKKQDKNKFIKDCKNQNSKKLAAEIMSFELGNQHLLNLENLQCKTLIIYGTLENKGFKKSSNYLAKTIPNCQLKSFPMCMHDIPQLHAKKLNEEIINFVDKVE